jgi:hypothetical protein
MGFNQRAIVCVDGKLGLRLDGARDRQNFLIRRHRRTPCRNPLFSRDRISEALAEGIKIVLAFREAAGIRSRFKS